MKIFSYLFLLVFTLFALFQWNDPDPYLWIPIYGFSAYTSYCAANKYYNPMLLSLLILAYLIGAIYLFPFQVSTWISMEQKAKSLQMNMPFIEEARESLGLIICGFVNTVYLIYGMKLAKSAGYNTNLFSSLKGKLDPNK